MNVWGLIETASCRQEKKKPKTLFLVHCISRKNKLKILAEEHRTWFQKFFFPFFLEKLLY